MMTKKQWKTTEKAVRYFIDASRFKNIPFAKEMIKTLQKKQNEEAIKEKEGGVGNMPKG
jgi:glucose-6-phosphate 1-dehydrogenase